MNSENNLQNNLGLKISMKLTQAELIKLYETI